MRSSQQQALFRPRRSQQWRESAIRVLLALCAAVSVVTTVAIVVVLLWESALFFREVSPWEFLTGTRWAPKFQPQSFGVLPLVCGTLLVVVGSALVALPAGLITGIYLSEYARPRTRAVLKPILEILAGIPTVVYGYFALYFITPGLMAVFPGTERFNAASAAIAVGVMILPMVASICDDAFQAVPDSLRQGAYALGARRRQVVLRVVLPAALSGVIASYVLALSRAVGETMIVTLAAGANPQLTLNPLEAIQTMTAYIVQVSLGDTPAGTVEYHTLYAVGLLLFLITFSLNVVAQRVLRRFREEYE